ncbi:bifunctional folylpolyglutamate synthase/dihydrofolate synthase [Enterococcus dispar]|uniref:bifunctional folylpolyglutamate synthase/dihydrofolate synthase n=1 Tax=Enterococcus dispar TaxID=44009 RepID=UPI0023309DCC|nr:folylpolyglutamate synthase/dihydrofolate synthase family protein [Enterococcus dispar]WCG33949.1 bifunctional folylpolyglutamate synthase/dihydrofolate synthase [Enterococcus dispar]
MVDTGSKAIEWIHSRKPFGSRPGLQRVAALLDLVGHPEKKVPTIHIAGTNGKGSTISYLKEMLQAAGIVVGTFTSPYIESFHERIAIDGKFITDEELVLLVNKYQPLVEKLDQQEAVSGITEFEVLTALAFDYFVGKVDVAIIEVGLGGLLDSTNVVEPMLTAITTIGYDHTEILGDTLELIAEQKAGIIKENVPVVTGNIPENALGVITQTADKKHSTIYRFGEEYQVNYLHPDDNWGEWFDFSNQNGKLKHLKTALIGRHQPENAGVAIQLFQLYCEQNKINWQEKEIKKALQKTFWPARMERLSTEPFIILDGAHNTHAMKSLVESVQNEFSDRKLHILFSALETKNVAEMLQELLQLKNSHIYLTTFDYPRAIKLDDDFVNVDEKRVSIVSLWQFGLAEILEKMDDESLLLVTGSLYFVAEVRSLLLEMGGPHVS